MELTDSGLFWIPDETELTHGWAVVCGPEDTPYYGGAFCFEVRFPDDYPFSPPSFNYLTNDGRTRFNPNLYKNGKVCLSLLNTWQGEQWSGVQSLSSILQCIQTAVLIPEPLRNEPGFASARTHAQFAPYRRMVFHSVLETAILGHLGGSPAYLLPILDAVKVWVSRARERLVKKARELAAVWDDKVERVDFFNMTQKYRFGALATALEGLSLPSGEAAVGGGSAVTEEVCEF